MNNSKIKESYWNPESLSRIIVGLSLVSSYIAYDVTDRRPYPATGATRLKVSISTSFIKNLGKCDSAVEGVKVFLAYMNCILYTIPVHSAWQLILTRACAARPVRCTCQRTFKRCVPVPPALTTNSYRGPIPCHSRSERVRCARISREIGTIRHAPWLLYLDTEVSGHDVNSRKRLNIPLS